MTYAELATVEERINISNKIKMIIGTKESWINEKMDLSTKIKTRARYDKTFEKLAKVLIEHGEKALSMNFMDYGSYKEGITPNGKKWVLDMNCGTEERSRTCGTLRIDGKVIFTSGTLTKSFEYILNN